MQHLMGQSATQTAQRPQLRRLQDGLIRFDHRCLAPRPVVSLLDKTLPIDITFVDENDIVRYFSRADERVFPGPKQSSAAMSTIAIRRKVSTSLKNWSATSRPGSRIQKISGSR
jgi:hypothetical protein